MGDPTHETQVVEANAVTLLRVRGVQRDAVSGSSARADSLGFSRRHFLPEGDDFGGGGPRTVELLLRHPVQLFRREMPVLMQVLVLLGSR